MYTIYTLFIYNIVNVNIYIYLKLTTLTISVCTSIFENISNIILPNHMCANLFSYSPITSRKNDPYIHVYDLHNTYKYIIDTYSKNVDSTLDQFVAQF